MKLRKLLEAKTKEADELHESQAKLHTELNKLRENTERYRKEKAELRKNQLSTVRDTVV